MTQPTPSPADYSLPSSFSSFREGQLEVATDLALCPSRFPLLNMPTGMGKSLVAMTTAKILDARVCIVTPQKAHQSQYMGDFGPENGGDLADVRGQSNYTCPRYGNCEVGAANECPLRRAAADHPNRDRCPNIIKIEEARQASAVVTNNAFWMTQGRAQDRDETTGSSNPRPGIGKFDLLVLDEGHSSPERLADFCSVELIEKEVERFFNASFPTSSSLRDWAAWAATTSRLIPNQLKDASPRDRYRLLTIARELSTVSSIPSNTSTTWILQRDTYIGKVSFTPVWASEYAETLLFQGTKKVVLASATLPPLIWKYLGVEQQDTDFIDVDNGFDPRNRPFIHSPTGVKLRYPYTVSAIRNLTSRYDAIIDLWRGYKGLVHTQSYDIQERFLAATRNRARMIVCEKCGMTGTEAIAELKASKHDMVAVGPALKEGHDLADDAARFQIIFKMPVPNKQNPVTKARCDSIPSYYMDQIALDLRQMAGRLVRSKADWGYTLTGDDAWWWVKKRAQFPDSFVRSFVQEQVGRMTGPPRR